MENLEFWKGIFSELGRSKVLVQISVLPAGFFKAGAHCLALNSVLIVPYFKDMDFY